jgi:putative addiction module killer protein
MYSIVSTKEYLKWFETQPLTIQGQILARLERIIEYDHFGDARHLGDSLAELKWKNGLRIYFSVSQDDEGNVLLLLIGGNKNSQKSDIKVAKKILFDLSMKD